MSILYRIFNSLITLFRFKKEPIIEEKKIDDNDGVLITPIRFAYPDEEEESERTLDQSLRMKEILLISDMDKKLKISKTTRDPILQQAILETMNIALILELINNPWVEEDILTLLLVDARYDNERIRMELAKRPSLPLSTQRLIAKSDLWEVRREFLLWQRPINPSIGELFIHDSMEENRIILAKNIGVGMKVNNILFFRGNFEDIQRRMMKDPSTKVLAALASNEALGPNVQSELVDFLYHAGEFKALTNLARNKSLNVPAQKKIIEIGKKPTIRLLEIRMMMKALRENPSLDKELLDVTI